MIPLRFSRNAKANFFLMLLLVTLYASGFYGGIRSPDGEVVYRTAESLALRGTFAVSEDLPWRGFGLPEGLDGQRYSIFGPGMSLAAAPFIYLFDKINASNWHNGYAHLFRNLYAGTRAHHELANRFFISSFNIIVMLVLVYVFYLWIKRETCSEVVAKTTALVFGVTSLFVPYASYFFSEPLCAVFVVLAFARLPLREEATAAGYLLAGLYIGVATSIHVTAILFVPFLFLYGFTDKGPIARSNVLRRVLFYSLGLLPTLVLLCVYNYMRFGNVFETGRTVDMIYATWVTPWLGVYGLLLSPSKGIVWHLPFVVLALFCVAKIYPRRKQLCQLIGAMMLIRLLFIAVRSDWAGGWCVGPRYMLLIMPFFYLFFAFWLQEFRLKISPRLRVWLALFVALCAMQQFYFISGDIFSYLYMVLENARASQMPLLDAYYLSWQTTSLLFMHETGPGPLVLYLLNDYDTTLCIIVALLVAFLTFELTHFLLNHAD